MMNKKTKYINKYPTLVILGHIKTKESWNRLHNIADYFFQQLIIFSLNIYYRIWLVGKSTTVTDNHAELRL